MFQSCRWIKLDLFGTLLLSGLQSHAAHGIVVTVLVPAGNTQNFHAVSFLLKAVIWLAYQHNHAVS